MARTIKKKSNHRGTENLPPAYQNFFQEYPKVAQAYHDMGEAAHNWGPLDEKTRALVKLGIAVGTRSEGAVHSHVRKALEAKASQREIRHAILLSVTTVGFPVMIAALTWAEDLLPS